MKERTEKASLTATEAGTIVRLYGELDLSNVAEMEALVEDGMELGGGYLAVDLNQLDFMDSQGVHMLYRLNREADKRGRRFFVLCEDGLCRKVIEGVGADRDLDLRRSPDELAGCEVKCETRARL